MSVGASLSTCSQPGIKKDTRLDNNTYELGLGIHGEPGVKNLPMEKATLILDRMNEVLMAGLTKRKIDLKKNTFTLLVNNLGGCPPIEQTFLAGKALEKFAKLGVKVSHVIIGTLLTSLDMNGFSLSLAAAEGENYLLGETGATSWLPLQEVNNNYKFLIPYESPKEEKFKSDISDSLKAKIRAGLEAVIAIEPDLTAWDQKSGDGDCGHTMKKGAETILSDLDSYPNDPADLCSAVARTISHSMGGSSGVLLAMFFEAASASIKENNGKDAVLTGFRAGVDSIMLYGGAVVGSCTMVDALCPAKEGNNI